MASNVIPKLMSLLEILLIENIMYLEIRTILFNMLIGFLGLPQSKSQRK